MKAAIIIKGVLQGLAHLHADSIVHRDMKTENIVLGETRTAVPILDPTTGAVIGARFTEKLDVKVIDFGLVKYMNLSSLATTPSPGMFKQTGPTNDGIVHSTPCGTEVYYALEVLEGILGSNFNNWKSTKEQLPKFDVYGAGTALYCMVQGTTPFPIRPEMKQWHPVQRYEAYRKLVANGPAYWTSACPPPLKKLTQRLLRSDVRNRPSAHAALLDPALQGVGTAFEYDVMTNGDICNARLIPSPNASATPNNLASVNVAAVDPTEAPADIDLSKGALDDLLEAVRAEEDNENDTDDDAF